MHLPLLISTKLHEFPVKNTTNTASNGLQRTGLATKTGYSSIRYLSNPVNHIGHLYGPAFRHDIRLSVFFCSTSHINYLVSLRFSRKMNRSTSFCHSCMLSKRMIIPICRQPLECPFLLRYKVSRNSVFVTEIDHRQDRGQT